MIQACQRGSQAAWDELVDRYGRLVYSIAHRYGLPEADADDLFQSVFLILFRRLDSLKDQTRLSAWLITTAHRECWRIGKRSGNVADIDEKIADLGSPSEEQLILWERQHLVRQALEQLGGRCEDLLRALFLELGEASYDAIAERLGMKVGSIGPTRARCFARLEKILVKMGVEAPGEVESPAGEAEA